MLIVHVHTLDNLETQPFSMMASVSCAQNLRPKASMPNTSHQKFVMTKNHQGLQRSPMSFSSTQRAGFQALAPKDFVTYLEKLPEAEPFPDV